MARELTRRQALSRLSLWGIAPAALVASRAPAQEGFTKAARSGYRLRYSHVLVDLIGDLDSDRGDPRKESDVPHTDWYSYEVLKQRGSWGPRARTYPVFHGIHEKPLEWKRERAVAAGSRFLFYGYQHHHIPDWNPPTNWPWQQTCAGKNGKGVDCSNFTSFVYNQAFGIRLSADVVRQSESRTALEGGSRRIEISHIHLPASYEHRHEVLRTGDLLYIRGREDGPITHVVLWVGSSGESPSGVSLVMDSHGANVKDDDDNPIPCGVQLRPFRKGSWYDRCASHALRIFRDPKS